MATKKGSVQQLQAEINTNDEFGKFIERDGLLVMDVYTDWCGPCLGMVGSLKKIKLELGGDDLHLAVCRSDDIDSLKRFRNKSEPTWLFVSSGKVVNILFGCNVPKLMRVIAEELRLEKLFRSGEYERKFYDFDELTPEEQERTNVHLEEEKEALIVEEKAAEQKRADYTTHITKQITTNLIDHGVIMFLPSVAIKDNLKRVMDAADTLGMACKERKVAQVLPEMLSIMKFKCTNALEDYVWEKIYNRDIQVAIFRIADQETRTVEEVFNDLITEITLPQTVTTVNEAGEEVQVVCSPIVTPFQFVLKKEVKESDDGPVQMKEENISVGGAWTPANKETNAALIYLFFRHLTEHFLPPDPIPEPPHLTLIYDAFKRNDIMDVYNKHKPFMLAYGYFAGGDPKTPELIANTTDSYLKKKPMITDKLVLKVTKGSVEALDALKDLGPTYISKNTVIGHQECLLYFPEGYTNLEEGEGVEEEVVEVSKKKRKRKKKKDEENSSVRNGEEDQIADISALDEAAQDTADEKNSPTEEKSATEDH